MAWERRGNGDSLQNFCFCVTYEDDSESADMISSRLFHQYLFRLKIKEELFGDEQRVKITVVEAGKMDYTSESRYLLDLISKLH